MEVKIEQSWKTVLTEEFNKEYFSELVNFVKEEYSKYEVFPPGNQIFNAFNACPFQKVRVVIIGQDPYHGKGQANGLCFSVKESICLKMGVFCVNNFFGHRAGAGLTLTRWPVRTSNGPEILGPGKIRFPKD